MTRCPDCGAERDSDQCPACGLTSAAAEVMMRRRLVRRTAVFLVGAIAFIPASQLYPPLELDTIWIFVGILFFLVLGFAVWIERRARAHTDVELFKRVYYGFVPVPWILLALLLVNGRLDNALPARESASVVGKFSMPGVFKSNRLVVSSWRRAQRFERLPVDRDDYDRFQRGDRVVVELRDGALGIPWVSGVSRP